MKIIAHSEQETKDFAKKFAAKLEGGMILCLYGELGAGKTTFVKGLAEGLGISENITSPTFTLMNIYTVIPSEAMAKSRNPFHNLPIVGERDSSTRANSVGMTIERLIHIDTYRLKNEKELIEIGAEDYVGAPDSITVIEWPERIADFLKEKKVIKIYLDHASENKREIKVEK